MSGPLQTDRDAAVARVNGEDVPRWLLIQEVRTLVTRWMNAGHERPTPEEWEVIRADALENAVEHVLLLQQARVLMPRVPDRDARRRLQRLAAAAGGIESHARAYGQAPDSPWLVSHAANQLRLERLFAHLTAAVPEPAAAAVEAQFQSRPHLAPERAEVSAIIVEIPPNADKQSAYTALLNARSRAQAGDSFEVMARRLNTHPDLRRNGGDLGILENDDSPTARAVFTLQPGGVSDVIEVAGAYYLFHLRNLIPSRALTLEECAPAIREALWDQAKNEEIGRKVDEWRAAAAIEILPEPKPPQP